MKHDKLILGSWYSGVDMHPRLKWNKRAFRAREIGSIRLSTLRSCSKSWAGYRNRTIREKDL